MTPTETLTIITQVVGEIPSDRSVYEDSDEEVRALDEALGTIKATLRTYRTGLFS
ncbi:hypothetical protein ACFS27_13710 [Promicromonospora vindobonensis]|uniref:Uncharacterized protein n=1 Tax=Promicromonospora vindobonensis TaxID=195748 RepID=A0ABW5VSF8_9MICO